MTDLASTHLRQARAALRGGDSAKALELLEKAKVLARGNRDVLAQVYAELVNANEAAGRSQEAQRFRERGDRIARPEPRADARTADAAAGTATAGRGGLPPVVVPPSNRKGAPVALLVSVGVLLVLLLFGGVGGALWYSYYRFDQASEQARLASIAAAQWKPAPRPVASTNPSPVVPATQPAVTTAVATTLPITPAVDRQQLLKENVGMVILQVTYDGTAGGRHMRIDIPFGGGTAFAVAENGVMLTNRHVADGAKEITFPPNLANVGLPQVNLVGTSLLVCFGKDLSDRLPATVLHNSDQFDLSVLHVDRRFTRPLKLATSSLRQGDDICVCGYPGIVTETLNEASQQDPSASAANRLNSIARKWRTSGNISPLDEFSADVFNSTLTKGIVSAPERNVQGVLYMQIDAGISPGNSGGPVLNMNNEVMGIATWTTNAPVSGGAVYNFALLLDQARSELASYMRGTP